MLLLLPALAIPSPDFCYSFNNPTIKDECTSQTILSKYCKMLLYLANSGAPFCDGAGCSFGQYSYFYTPVPSGMADTWTIGLWLRDMIGSSGTSFSII